MEICNLILEWSSSLPPKAKLTCYMNGNLQSHPRVIVIFATQSEINMLHEWREIRKIRNQESKNKKPKGFRTWLRAQVCSSTRCIAQSVETFEAITRTSANPNTTCTYKMTIVWRNGNVSTTHTHYCKSLFLYLNTIKMTFLGRNWNV